MTDTNDNNTNVEQEVDLTAGEMLRNARTTGRRKREILTISKQLCIREEFLQALEDGDYAAIPETVYILGFARNYAMELGLDPDEIVNKIKREIGLVADAASAKNEAENEPAARTARTVTAPAATTPEWMQVLRRNWMWVAGAAVVLIVALVLGLLLALGGDDGEEVPAVPVQIVSTDTVAEPKYNMPVRERFGTENRDKANVILQAMQDGWVKIEDARGNTVFSRVLVAGDVFYVPDGAGHKAIFGNAGGIDIWANGVLMEKAGPAHTRKAGISLNPDALKPAKPVVVPAQQ